MRNAAEHQIALDAADAARAAAERNNANIVEDARAQLDAVERAAAMIRRAGGGAQRIGGGAGRDRGGERRGRGRDGHRH